METSLLKIRRRFSAFNWLSGIWLLFLFYPLSMAWPFDSLSKALTLILIVIFLPVYYEVYKDGQLPYWHYWLFAGIALENALSFFGQGPWYFLYFAWAIGWIEHRKAFLFFYLLHVISYLLLMSYLLMQAHWLLIDLQMAIIYGLFAFLAPIAGHNIVKQREESLQLNQSNVRLTRQIKQDERERIARDLHDTLGQSFSMISIKTEFAEKILKKQPDNQAAIRQQLEDIAETSRHNLQLVRDIVSDLRRETLASALISESTHLQAANIRLLTTDEAQISSWPDHIQNIFAACFSETVTNIIRHSQANRCIVDFSQGDHLYTMTVSDNGVGFNKKEIRMAAHGLLGIRERLEEAGGQLTISSSRVGTKLAMTLAMGGEI